MKFYEKINLPEFKKNVKNNEIKVSYFEGPKVEIIGDDYKEYLVEFDTIHCWGWLSGGKIEKY